MTYADVVRVFLPLILVPLNGHDIDLYPVCPSFVHGRLKLDCVIHYLISPLIFVKLSLCFTNRVLYVFDCLSVVGLMTTSLVRSIVNWHAFYYQVVCNIGGNK